MSTVGKNTHTSVISTIMVVLILTLIPTPDQKAEAAITHIEFSGEFAQCLLFAPCVGTPLEQLLGTTFSGQIEIPDSGVDEQPGDPERGFFAFGTNAFMTLNTEVAEFNLSTFSPVTVFVGNCIGGTCNFNEDVVFISVSTNGYIYSLNLSTPRPSFESDQIPPVEALLTTYASFDISTADFNHDITIDVDNNPQFSPMLISITSVPIPASIWLLGSLFGLLFCTRRCNVAS